MNDRSIKKEFVRTSFGNIAYLERGSSDKPALLFIHGIPTSSYLWRHVIRFLQNDFYCLAPDLIGLGDSDVDPYSDHFHMDAQAEMLWEFMKAKGHDSFSIIAHDQGGAAAQIMMANGSEQITSVVLTDCVCYDNWPVPVIARYQALARVPFLAEAAAGAGLLERIETVDILSAYRRGVYDKQAFSKESIHEYLRPLTAGKRERDRFLNFLRAGDNRFTMRVAKDIKEFRKPTMIIWAAEDYYIRVSWGKKLFEDIPGAERLEIVPFCGHFWQEERPSEFASLMGAFLSQHTRKE